MALIKKKEFNQLNRAELMTMVIQLQEENRQFREREAELNAKLQSRDLHIANAGSIADAVLKISDIFTQAQDAADYYLAEVQSSKDKAQAQIDQKLLEAEKKAEAMIREAEAEAEICCRDKEDQIMLAQSEAKKIVGQAEEKAAAIIAAAEKEAEAKWLEVDGKVQQLIASYSELAALLK